MAESLTIARPYAEAAFKIAIEQQALPAWSDALARLSSVLQRPEAVALVINPSLSAAQISDVITDSAGQLSGEQKNFVRVLADNERLSVVNEITQHFSALRNDHEKVLNAHVSTAFALSEAQVAEIKTTLQTKYGKQVDITVALDPELIGGVSIRIGDEVMDASVRGKLAQLAAALVTQ